VSAASSESPGVGREKRPDKSQRWCHPCRAVKAPISRVLNAADDPRCAGAAPATGSARPIVAELLEWSAIEEP